MRNEHTSGTDLFMTTHWSVVRNARDGSDNTATRQALSKLCENYWYPVYGYVRRRGNDAHRAEDLTQGFFLAFIEKDYLKSVSQDKGKFRAFLLASVKNYMANVHDRETAQKRGGGAAVVTLDSQLAEQLYKSAGTKTTSADAVFDHEWALTVLRTAQEALRSEYEKAGKGAIFAALLHTMTIDDQGTSYQDIATELSMSESAVKVAAHRLRNRYRKQLREAVGQTVSDNASIDEELKYLISCM
jgi:RNA polymerase sigma factor (sigma-70 family)